MLEPPLSDKVQSKINILTRQWHQNTSTLDSSEKKVCILLLEDTHYSIYTLSICMSLLFLGMSLLPMPVKVVENNYTSLKCKTSLGQYPKHETGKRQLKHARN